MSKRGLILLLVLLLLILAAEGALICLYPTAGGYPWSPAKEPLTTQNTVPNTTTDPTNTDTQPDPEENEDLVATMTFDVENENAMAGTLHWTETWSVVSNETPAVTTEKEITVHVTSTREDDVPSDHTYLVKKDGTVTMTKWVSNSSQGQLDCDASIPVFLPQGIAEVSASMNCLANGQPLFSFNGQGSSSRIFDFNFEGTIVKAQTITITSGGITAPTPQATTLPASFEGTYGVGLGPIEFVGSIADLLFGQLGTAVSSDGLGQLQTTTSTTLWQF